MSKRILPALGSLALCGLISGLATAAAAQDFVRTKGKLSDRDFYRLVTCGAPPGKECQFNPARWPGSTPVLTVGFNPRPQGVAKATYDRVLRETSRAVGEINGTGAGITLKLASEGRPDILIKVVDTKADRLIKRSDNWQEEINSFGAGAFVQLYSGRRRGEIGRAEISFSSDLPRTVIRSIALEELVQSLGLVFDIDNGYYRSKSIFAERSNSVKRLRGQDAMALRTHYPPADG